VGREPGSSATEPEPPEPLGVGHAGPAAVLAGPVVHRLAPNITWGSWNVPVGLSLGLVAVMGLTMMGVAIAEFRKTE